MTVRNLILSGGVNHPCRETSARLAELLAEVGIESEVTEDLDAAMAGLASAPVDLVTVNALRWRMGAERYAPQRDEWALHLSSAARTGMLAHLRRAGGLLGIHTASICFDDWPEWGRILGGAWDWDRSSHPPLGEARVSVAPGGDPLVSGLGDFATVDEIYGFLRTEPDVEGLLVATHGGVAHPVLWRRHFGAARVVYDALGHDLRGYEPSTQREVIRRAGRWAATGEWSGR
ncbi:ThuA domain-containing protein [Acidimicrobiaceae bacterium USS-CC1]|uniref:ThuA domain-containing protein n=1 Tax=Acidiferrimicrobium australe TaxID=2664430 RepID=A0ABW9QU14_9ACTN|nr:ThuA domain-containing protein [Acidiferrimicrobium australe]